MGSQTNSTNPGGAYFISTVKQGEERGRQERPQQETLTPARARANLKCGRQPTRSREGPAQSL